MTDLPRPGDPIRTVPRTITITGRIDDKGDPQAPMVMVDGRYLPGVTGVETRTAMPHERNLLRDLPVSDGPVQSWEETLGVQEVALRFTGAWQANYGVAREILDRPVRQAVDEEREALGRLVRDEWIRWASEQPEPKASWLAPWEALTDEEREVDRRIADRIREVVIRSHLGVEQ